MTTSETVETRLERTMHRRDRDRVRRGRRRRWTGRAALGVLLAVGLVVGWSFGHALAAPGGDSLSTKAVEWVRDHGGDGIVNRIENWWYSSHAPPRGGRPRGNRLPSVAAPVATTPTTLPRPLPATITPFAAPALPNEGVWLPTGKLVQGVPAVFATFLRPDPVHTSLVATVMWMDTRLLRGALYNGIEVPGGGPWVHGPNVAPIDGAPLVAAFNGGFKLATSQGGYFTEGRVVRPLVDGRASVVITTDGTVSVDLWGRDAAMGPQIASVRQNLDLLVDGGRPVPGLNANDTTQWGATLGNKVYVWRSGLCTDRNGDLEYFAGPGLNIVSLANLEVAAGCQRGMELDINSAWTTGYTFTGGTSAADPIVGHKLLASMQRPDNRYLVPGTRDFVALFAR